MQYFKVVEAQLDLAVAKRLGLVWGDSEQVWEGQGGSGDGLGVILGSNCLSLLGRKKK